jgi:hypothetical protein
MTSKTSTTDAGGAGNDYDGDLGKYDASNLDLSGITPTKQGYHIKLDVATGEPGGHKYKVFWLTPCTSTTPGGGTEGGGETGGTNTGNGGETGGTNTGNGGETGGTTQTGTVSGTGTQTGGATVLGETVTRATTQTTQTTQTIRAGTSATAPGTAPGSTARVLGERVTRPSTSGVGSLPFTGAETGVLSALGLAALGGGAALTVAGRRRRSTARA